MDSLRKHPWKVVVGCSLSLAATVYLVTKRGKRVSKVPILQQRLSRMHTPESLHNGLNCINTRSSDVFIVSYPKCGTTWVQQIAHQIRSNGDMKFQEITCETPWTICALDCNVDINADQRFSPRLFKSHESEGKIAKGGKYIYLLRNPRSVLVSFHKFVTDYCGLSYETDISLDEFAEQVYFGSGTNSGTYLDHIKSWYPRFNDKDVMVVCYEDLHENIDICIDKIASFMDISVDEALLQVVKTNSSFNYMSEHRHQFDGHFVHDCVKERMGVSSELSVGKIRKGGGQKSTVMDDKLGKQVDEWWKEGMNVLGYETYEDMRKKYSLLR